MNTVLAYRLSADSVNKFRFDHNRLPNNLNPQKIYQNVKNVIHTKRGGVSRSSHFSNF